MTPDWTAPGADEFEVTLLGRGRGESCVVHLGGGRWMVVDTFIEPSAVSTHVGKGTRRSQRPLPAAAVYLDRLEVDVEAVKLLVITHFHRDHYEGVRQLHQRYTQARLFITDAVRHEKLRAIFSRQAGPPPLEQVRVAMEEADRRRFGTRGTLTGLIKVRAGAHLSGTGPATVQALAPAEAAGTRANIRLSEVLSAEATSADISEVLRNDNSTSIALHVRACGSTALLGGDVVNEPRELGWVPVLDHADELAADGKQLSSADLVKVPHHGSHGADHGPMWETLVRPGAPMLIAPFWDRPQRTVPQRQDQLRLISRGPLFQTNEPGATLTNEFAPAAEQRARTGIVQARRRPGEDWRIGWDGPAHQVGPTSPEPASPAPSPDAI